MDRLLLIRTDKVGDLVLATPCIQAAKEKWPSWEIHFMASRYAAPVLEQNPHLEGVILCDGEGPGDLSKSLKKMGFHAAVALFPTFPLAWALSLAKIPVRVASGFRWYQGLFNRRVYLRRSRCLKKEWEYNQDLLKPLGWEGPYREPCLYLSSQELDWAQDLARGEGWPRDFVVLYPGGGKEMRWSSSSFRELGRRIQHMGLGVVVFWGPGEKGLADEVAGEKGGVAPSTNLRELMALLSLSKAMVANNTGPMHIGAALGVPLVQLFDPRRGCNPLRWGHEGLERRILMPPVPHCRKCSSGCTFYPCMERLTPEEVLRALEEVLNGG
jgi:ADP-heptose:LPS heptosyltransferase